MYEASVDGDLSLGLVDQGLVGSGVDFEQEFACLDHGPFFEGHLDQVAGDPSAHGHGLDGIGAARVFDEVGDFLADRMADGNDRRPRRWPLGGSVVAATPQRPQQGGQDRK